MNARRFELHRHADVSGVSGTGVVADGVVFPDGVAALRWRGPWPTSVVFHERGVDSVRHVHGHGGATAIVWLDPEPGRCALCQHSHAGEELGGICVGCPCTATVVRH